MYIACLFSFCIFRVRFSCHRCSFTTVKKDVLERHKREDHNSLAKCGFGCDFVFPLHKKCLLRDHHKKHHAGLRHKDPIMFRSDRGRSRSRSPIEAAPGACVTMSPFVGSPPRTPTMSDVDEFVFTDLVEEDLDHNNNVCVLPETGGSSPQGDTAGPASPDHGPVEWKLVPVDVDIMKPIYSFLPKPCKYTEYYLRGDPRFHQK